MIRQRLPILVAVACLLLAHAVELQAVTIISESFGGLGTDPLNGTMTDVGGLSWTASAQWNADGSKPNTGSGHAFVPFTPAAGNVYTLSLTVNPDTNGPDISDWFALGFSASNNTSNSFHNGPNNAVGWILNREDDNSASAFQTFLGPSTAGNASHDPAPNLVGPIDLDVILDTNPANPEDWTVEWLADGTSLRGPVALGFVPTINYVGFGAFEDATGTVANFSLADATAVPEPTTIAIWSVFGIIGLAYVRFRRR